MQGFRAAATESSTLLGLISLSKNGSTSKCHRGVGMRVEHRHQMNLSKLRLSQGLEHHAVSPFPRQYLRLAVFDLATSEPRDDLMTVSAPATWSSGSSSCKGPEAPPLSPGVIPQTRPSASSDHCGLINKRRYPRAERSCGSWEKTSSCSDSRPPSCRIDRLRLGRQQAC